MGAHLAPGHTFSVTRRRFEQATYLSAVERVRKACQKLGKAIGLGCCSLEHAKACASQRNTFLLIGGDDTFLAAEARRWMEALR